MENSAIVDIEKGSIQDITKTIFDDYQESNWINRSIKYANTDRIALFQFETKDSYKHPVSEKCKESGQKGEIDDKDYKGYSCEEFRRRKLLEPVLNACNLFDVEILVFTRVFN